jgi:CheY-like chemotaxis protein
MPEPVSTTSKEKALLNVGKILIVDDEKFNYDIIEGFLMILEF